MTAKKPLTIVIKLGTSSIVTPTYPFLPLIGLLSSIVETVVKLRELGHRVVLCSSGAIGVGLRRMGVKERGKALSQKQALAAIGQGRLITLWDNLFSQLDQPIAQILLTRMDISDRTRYLNAQNTFSELLTMGVVPIVNENDTVSVSEIKFGDNDTLSAISGAIVHADYLFLLTDVECLYTDNPRQNPEAKPVRVVRDVERIRSQVSVATLGTSLGTGGMSTKLIAADLATAAGITTVIMRSENVKDIFRIVEGGPAPSRESVREADLAALEEGPLCTRFLRREVALKDRKWWIAHGLHAAGTVVIDEGALRAIKRRESGYRILPAGVVRVEGAFASHQAVRIIVRRGRRRAPEAASGAASGAETPYRDSDECPTPDPAREYSRERETTTRQPASRRLGNHTSNASSPDAGSTPHTPLIQPVMSLSSSIASLDPLSRTAPPSPGIHALAERLSISTVLGGSSGLRESTTLLDVPDEEPGEADGEHRDEYEEQEVGKGLAQYNSAEIDRLKGMKSSHIESVLGYCDSEHVVDSITLWV